MNNFAIKHFAGLVTVAVIAAGITGCTAASDVPGGSEVVGTARQAWGATCLSATPDQSFAFSGSYTSVATYSNSGCYKGEVIEYDDISMTTETYITWDGTTPPGGSACNDLFLGVYAWSL